MGEVSDFPVITKVNIEADRDLNIPRPLVGGKAPLVSEKDIILPGLKELYK